MKEFDYDLLSRKYAGYLVLLRDNKISTTKLRELKFVHGNDFKNVFKVCYPVIVKLLDDKGFELIREKGLRSSVNFICKKKLDNNFSL